MFPCLQKSPFSELVRFDAVMFDVAFLAGAFLVADLFLTDCFLATAVVFLALCAGLHPQYR